MANKKAPRKMTWRDFGDGPALKVAPNPESLHPGPSTVLRALCGDDEARAILTSYAFNYPVKMVEALDAF